MLPNFDRRVVVLGDVMLDRFLYGEASRLSPEAPVPVVDLLDSRSMAGGAGNVTRNIQSLGGDPILITLVGTDSAGIELEQLLTSGSHVIGSRERRTTVKLRVIAAQQQVVRVDDEEFRASSPTEEAALLDALTAALPGAGALVLSDYDKGVLTPSLCAKAIEAARRAGVVCLVDPKGRDFARYAGADILTPNARELAEASGMPTETDAQVEAAARAVLERVEVGAVLATRSGKGMMLVPRHADATTEPAMAREVFDVSGAGDTVIATLALSIAGGASLPAAMRLANAAAGVVVGKVGTAVCSADELIQALREAEGGIGQILPLDSIARLAREWHAEGLRVGFANGCFDILHAGHTLMLREARRRCDKLIVALNTDASVSRLKGPSRPLNALSDRATVIGALSFVDAVTSFGQDTPLDAILAIRPDRLFKGADYALDEVAGARELLSWGGETVLLDLLPGRSTTTLVERARISA